MSFKSLFLILIVILTVSIKCEENMTIVDSNVNEVTFTNSTNEGSNTTPDVEAERLEFDNFSKTLLQQMGINQEKEISKERFKEFLTRLLTRDEKLEAHELELYNELIKRVTNKTPETIEVSNISKYIEQEELVNSLNELIRERYGEEALQQFNQEVNSDL